MQPIGKYIVLTGLAIVALGLIIWVAGNKFTWFGHLPGDVRITRPNFTFFAPITSMLLLSLAIQIIIWLIRKIL